MEVLTIEHRAFQLLISKIDAMDEFIRKAKLEQQCSLDDDWVDGQAVCEYLCICDKTLQRLRSAGKITYSTIGNKYYYQIALIERGLLERENGKRNGKWVVKCEIYRLKAISISCQKS